MSMRSVDYGGSLSGPTIIVEMVTEGSRLMADPVPIVYKPEVAQAVDFTARGRSISVWTLGTGLY